jgi:hypothetical protein
MRKIRHYDEHRKDYVIRRAKERASARIYIPARGSNFRFVLWGGLADVRLPKSKP